MNPVPLYIRIRSHIEKAGLSYAEVAEKTGWSERKAARLLTGRTHFRGDQIEQLAFTLGKPAGALFRAVGARRRSS